MSLPRKCPRPQSLQGSSSRRRRVLQFFSNTGQVQNDTLWGSAELAQRKELDAKAESKFSLRRSCLLWAGVGVTESPGRGRVWGATQPRGHRGELGPAASQRRLLQETRGRLRGGSCQEGGRERGCPRLPQAPRGPGLVGPQLLRHGPWSPSSRSPSAAVPGPRALGRAARCRQGARGRRAQRGHSAALDHRRARGSSFTPDGCCSLPRPPPLRAVGRGMRRG